MTAAKLAELVHPGSIVKMELITFKVWEKGHVSHHCTMLGQTALKMTNVQAC